MMYAGHLKFLQQFNNIYQVKVINFTYSIRSNRQAENSELILNIFIFHKMCWIKIQGCVMCNSVRPKFILSVKSDGGILEDKRQQEHFFNIFVTSFQGKLCKCFKKFLDFISL